MTRMASMVLALGLACSAPWAAAQAPAASAAPAAPAATAPVPLKDFFKQPDFAQVAISPNGDFLAAVVRTNDRRNLAVVEIKNGNTRVITNLQATDLAGFRWLSDQRLVYTLFDSQRGLADQTGAGLFAIDRDGSNFREIYPLRGTSDTSVGAYRPGAYVAKIPGTEEILVQAPQRSRRALDILRVDTRTGQRNIVVDRTPGEVIAWVADHQGVPRAAVTDVNDQRRRFAVFLRDSAETPWRKIAEFDRYDAEQLEPVAFDGDGSLLVIARAGGDKAALYRWDAAGNKLGERLVAHKDYDFVSSRDDDSLASGLVFDAKTNKLAGVRIEGERLEQVWFDPEWARMQAAIDAALPKHINRLSRSSNTDAVLVFSYSDRDPGRWYLLNLQKKQLQELVARMPWIKPEQMAEVKFIRYPARDGLSIPAYLTLPPGKPAKDLPLVVLVHGGPFLRGETWGYDAEAQFLASRGYAVLQADYRGSMGYGWKHYAAGWKQWGQAMQDDLSDGVKTLAAQGTVNPKRVCIMGGSYGGYATMMGLVKDPDLYRCGINMVGVTDLPMFIDETHSDRNYVPRYSDHFYENQVGHPSKDKAMLEANSPARHAARIKAPVMIVHGAGDVRVPQEHATKMRSALRDAGKEPVWIYYDDEGHGFLKESTRVDLYTQIERFLAENLK
jgi:dipeptidyl aminopeptidase/acylaminoacyl peptidase